LSCHHRNILTVNLSKLKQNFEAIQSISSPSTLMPILKANAYGLGSNIIARSLKEAGAKIIAVADLQEALELRDLDIDILILGDIIPEEIPLAIRNNFILPIGSLETAKMISQIADNRQVYCHVVIDSGMGRLGIPINQAKEEFANIAKLSNLKLEGIYSHFPVAYEDRNYSLNQLDNFKKLITDLHYKFKYIHLANSDGIHNIPEACDTPFNLVRSGLNLYGCYDLEGDRRTKLESVLSLKSRLVRVRKLKAGTSIGYGRKCILEKDTLVGTVALGYADGFPMSNHAYLLHKKRKCPLLGQVSMDYITVDLSLCPDAQSGDEIISLGNEITISDWARWKKTITYEVICSLGQRIKRKYLGEEHES